MVYRLDPELLLAAAENTPKQRVLSALRSQSLERLNGKNPTIPEPLRRALTWAALEQKIRFQHPPALLFTGALICLSAGQQFAVAGSIWWLLFGGAMMLFGGLSAAVSSHWVAGKLLMPLLRQPYVFSIGDDIYENLPQLNRMEQAIAKLSAQLEKSKQIVEDINRTLKALKEQLILLGQSTDDPSIKGLYEEESTQLRWQEETKALLAKAKQQHNQNLAIREELHQHARLDALRRQAAQLAGGAEHSAPQLIDLERSSEELLMELDSAAQKMLQLQLQWRTKSEVEGL